jgi:hypothetical protein
MKLSELSNAQLAVIAVARLGGETRAVDTEDIAIELGKFAQKRFCWRKYPEYLDLHVVRVALADAKRVEPPLLTGGIKDGWMLSLDGYQWISKVEVEDLGEEEGNKRRSVYAIQESERARLRRTAAFTKYLAGEREKISVNDLFEFMRVNEYFPDKQRRERYNAVQNAVVDDTDLSPIWEFLKKKFHNEVRGNEE